MPRPNWKWLKCAACGKRLVGPLIWPKESFTAYCDKECAGLKKRKR